MKYTKPEVNTLGSAASLIESIPVAGKHYPKVGDGTFTHDPAYELDE